MQNKRHVKNFKDFVNENLNHTQSDAEVNEGLFSWVKDKITMAISKKIGGASKIDAQTKAYMAQMMAIVDKEIQLEKDLSESDTAYKANPKDINLKKAFELKQKSQEGQKKANLAMKTALVNNYNLNLKKIVGGNNPMLSQYADMVKSENELAILQHTMQAYEKLAITGDAYTEASKKEAAQKAAVKQQQDALKTALNLEKSAEAESGDEAPADIKLNSKFKYKNSVGKELTVQVIDLLLKDKVASQNGTMVRVVNVNKLKEKDTAAFRVKKTALVPLRAKPAKEGEDIVTTNATEKEPAAQPATV